MLTGTLRRGQQVLDLGKGQLEDTLGRLLCVDRADSRGLGGGELVVGGGDRFKEVLALSLQAVGLGVACALTRAPSVRGDSQEQCAIGGETTRGEQVDGPYPLDPETPSGALVGERGVREAIEQDPGSSREQGCEALVHQLGACGG